jgi:tetratricopeptide (TPR) repeat protein
LSSLILTTTTGIWGAVVPPEDVVMTGTTDPQVRARFLMRKGQRLLKAGHPEEGLNSLRRGLDLALQHQLRAPAAAGLLNIGVAFRYLDQPDSALRYLEKARDVYARYGNSRAAVVASEHLRSVRQALETKAKPSR